MQVSVETINNLERKMTVDLPAEQVDAEVNKRLQELARTQRMNGFRPGKVPMSVVKKRFGKPVRQEVMGEVMQRSFFEAVTQEKLQPAGMPRIEPVQMDEGQDIKFTATFEVYPEVTVGDLGNIEFERPVAEATDDDLAKMLETLREQRGSWVEVKRKAKEGDQVVIDFVGTVDGEEFEGGKGSDVEVELGSDQMIPGFESGLVGASANSDVELKVTFPDDYQAEELAGKDAVFATHVKRVNKKELPTLTELAEQLGAKDGIKQLKADVRKNMERELASTIKSQVKSKVMDALVDLQEVDVPKTLIDAEIDRMRQDAVSRLGNRGKLPELPGELFEEQATRRVKLGLVVGEIIKQEDLKADDDKVRAAVDDLASVYEQSDEVVKWYYSDQNRLREVESLVLEDAVIELVASKAKVTDKSMTFDEVMNPDQDEAAAQAG